MQTVAKLRIGQDIKQVLETTSRRVRGPTAYSKSRTVCHDEGDLRVMRF